MAIEERPNRADPGAGELIVRPEAVGICGSEVEGYLGHMGNRTPPLVMGHEFAGTSSPPATAPANGRARASPSTRSAGCGAVPAVPRRPREPLPAAHADRRPPRRRVRRPRAPRRRPTRARCPTACPRASARWSSRWPTACTRCASGSPAIRCRAGGRASAPGTIGLMTLQAALLPGIAHVPSSSRRRSARERALALGAHAAFGDVDEARGRARRGEGLGADLVLDAVGAQATRATALELLRPGGRGGLHRPGRRRHDARLPRRRARAARAPGSYAYTMADFDQAHQWLVGGRASIGDARRGAPARGRAGGVRAARRRARRPREVKVFLAGAGREA